MKTNIMNIRLLVNVSGYRYDSKAGERRQIIWRKQTPQVVEQVTQQKPIDWGGTMVRFGDYEVLK
jgi:hypothetical protein